MDLLRRIKSLIVHRHYRYTVKAADKLETDDLEEEDVFESIRQRRADQQNPAIDKTTGRKALCHRKHQLQRDAHLQQGAIRREAGEEVYYIFVSAKRSKFGD
jgi:hypothetical protein